MKQGGHDVTTADVLRRYERGWRNFETAYRALADVWAAYDNSGRAPELLDWTMKAKATTLPQDSFAAVVGRALRRAGRVARKTAKAHGTPIYVWKKGKVVAEKP